MNNILNILMFLIILFVILVTYYVIKINQSKQAVKIKAKQGDKNAIRNNHN